MAGVGVGLSQRVMLTPPHVVDMIGSIHFLRGENSWDRCAVVVSGRSIDRNRVYFGDRGRARLVS